MLQPAMLSDLAVVASWITSARDCQFWAGDRVRFPINPATLPDEINYHAGNAFSLYCHARLTAFGQLVPKSQDRGHLATLIVDPSCRRKGYGDALLRGLLHKAVEANFERVSLYVDKQNSAAIALYTRLAFRDSAIPSGDRNLVDSRYMERLVSRDMLPSRTPLP